VVELDIRHGKRTQDKKKTLTTKRVEILPPSRKLEIGGCCLRDRGSKHGNISRKICLRPFSQSSNISHGKTAPRICFFIFHLLEKME
jgi:hypothetical protein